MVRPISGQGEVAETNDRVASLCCISEDKRRAAHDDTNHPDDQANHACQVGRPMVLRPDGKNHRHIAIKADGGEQKNTGVHVEDEEEGVQLAHDGPEDPVVAHGCVRNVYG